MYQSVPSLTISRENPLGIFLKGRIPQPSGTKKVQNPDGQLFSKTQQRSTKHEIEIVENSTETLICLEILKQ